MFKLQDNLTKKIIAITGASGYIGSALVCELEKCSVKKIIRISRKKLKPREGIEDWIIDLNYYNSWIKIINEADIIFHLSGNTSINIAEKDPVKSLMLELKPITNLVKASKQLNLKPRVIYASTATIYGLTEKFPVTENQTPSPITSYDANKLDAEKKLKSASNESLIESISLRLANVYGPSLNESSANDRGILSKIARMSFENKAISLYGSGDYIRDYIYIDDVISALIISSLVDYNKIHESSEIAFNVSSGKGTLVKNVFNLIIEEVEKITGTTLEVENVSWPIEVHDIEKRNFIGSSQRLKSFTGWTNKTSIEEGVLLLVNHYKKEYL